MKQTIVTTSWDDGHKLDTKLALLLKKYGLKGTIYISPKDREFNKKDLLSENDIKVLSKDFEIGAHTINHPYLTKIPKLEANYEIYASKKYLEEIIKKQVTSFCYPYGDYNGSVADLVKKNGFKLARTTKRYTFRKQVNVFALNTTFHTYNHLTDYFKFSRIAGLNLRSFITYLDWETAGKEIFDYCIKNKELFHIWGHSWEIDKFKAWDKLESLFSYISGRKNVKYVNNAELII